MASHASPNGNTVHESIEPPQVALLYFRDQLRDARAAALKDAEGFAAVLFAIERLGRLLDPKGQSLGDFEPAIRRFAERSALLQYVSQAPGRLQTPFHDLYPLVRTARNSALHEGAFARHLTSRSIELALYLEDALTTDMYCIGDFMVRTPVCASSWQPLALVRQVMLANSFSFLPLRLSDEGAEPWRVVSDHGLATYLRGATTVDQRRQLLAEPLDSAIASGRLPVHRPFVCDPECSVAEALAKCQGLPILIRGKREQDLVGIATPFDLL